MKKLLYIAILISLCHHTNTAQTQSNNLHLIARSYGDSITLRWGVLTPVAWQLISKQGFILERAVLDPNDKIEQNYTRVTTQPIKPWTAEECKIRIDPRTDRYAAIAAQALHGKSFQTKTEGDLNTKATNGTGTDNTLSQIINATEQLESRHALAHFAADISPTAATALALRWTDKNIKQDRKYIYRIYPAPQPQGLYRVDTAFFILSPRDKETPERMTDITTQGFEKKIQVQWQKLAYSNRFSAFFVERSDDNGKTFNPLSKDPYIQMQRDPAKQSLITYEDTANIINYQKYQYRVRGIDPFGDYSPYSNPVIGFAKDMTPPPTPILRKINKISTTAYSLEWTIPNPPSDLKGFLVTRCTTIDGKYKPLSKNILAPATRQFTDNNASATESNFYSIVALDTSGNAAASESHLVFSYDNIPPAPPTGLKGNIDTAGIVRITWDMGKERDLLGYRIFNANAPDHEFAGAATEMILDTFFRDSITLKTLSKHIYYKIVAVDNNLNSSEYSPILELSKPDIIPPVPPVILNFLVTDSTVAFNWAKSASEDVSKQIVYRRLKKEATWTPLSTLDKTTNKFMDTHFAFNQDYLYSIQSIDSSDLASEKSFPLAIHTPNISSKALRPVTNLKATPTNNNSIKLTWQNPTRPILPINAILIYRSTTTPSEWELISTTEGFTFEDPIRTNTKVKYAIKVRYQGGATSPLCNAD